MCRRAEADAQDLTVLCIPCRGGSLYGELARFVLRLLGFKDKSQESAIQPKGPIGNPPLPGIFMLVLNMDCVCNLSDPAISFKSQEDVDSYMCLC